MMLVPEVLICKGCRVQKYLTKHLKFVIIYIEGWENAPAKGLRKVIAQGSVSDNIAQRIGLPKGLIDALDKSISRGGVA